MTSASSLLIKNSVCKPLTCRGDPIGECEETPNGPVCHCKDGFKGPTCGTVFITGDNPCLRTPCWGDGTCVSTGPIFSCLCSAGRTGADCKTINDPSIIKPLVCFNNSTIENNTCVCLPDFTGSSCETFILPPPNPIEGSVKIYNKGGYVAVILFKYELNETNRQEKKSLTAPRKFTFKYDRRATNVEIIIDALAGRKGFLKTKIIPLEEINTCFHVWGTTIFPKFSRINCDKF